MRLTLRLLMTLASLALPSSAFAQVDAGNDFVAGDRLIYADNFDKVPPGMLPRNLILASGNVEVARVDARAVLRVTADPAQFTLRLPAAVPERFTLEMDMVLPPQLGWDQSIYLIPESDRGARLVHWDSQAGIEDPSGDSPRSFFSDIPRPEAPEGDDETAPLRWDHFQVMGDGNYIKVYVNGTRVANVPNVNLGRSNGLGFVIRGSQDYPILIGNIRVAAGGKDLYRALMEDGQATLEGIEFDTGSDALRPASEEVLQRVVAAFKGKETVAMIVQGHTDNVGNPSANQALSERRAKAVAARLQSLGLAAAQLKAEGLGASQPIAGNDTPEGRQRNRRVMLVRDY